GRHRVVARVWVFLRHRQLDVARYHLAALLRADLLLACGLPQRRRREDVPPSERDSHRRHLSICSAVSAVFTQFIMPSVTRLPTHLSMSSRNVGRSSSFRFCTMSGSVTPSAASFTSMLRSTTISQSSRVAFLPQAARKRGAKKRRMP